LWLPAAVGLVPFLQRAPTGEPVASAAATWAALVGPPLAIVFMVRVVHLVPAGAADVFGATLIGVGVLNLAWAGVAGWRAATEASAWRYSFLADWSLVLVALGLLVPAARAAAYLLLLAMLATRLPLYVGAVGAREPAAASGMAASIVAAAALVGAAPFAGFAARVLLLRAATAVYWPVAAVLAAGVIVCVPQALRLSRPATVLGGRARAALLVSLLASAAIGIYPAAPLAAAGLQVGG
jgi:hypothetical protein